MSPPGCEKSRHRHLKRDCGAQSCGPRNRLPAAEIVERWARCSEAAARLKTIGSNLIAQEERPSILRELAGRAKNPLNGLLLSLAFVSYLLGDIRAAIVIGVMVVLAIGTAFIQEHRSNEAAAKLRAMVRNTASVKRRGGTGNGEASQAEGFTEIPSENLVPGDIVHLSAGDMIPGDLLLLDEKDLFLNQATLTGEALPVEKRAEPAESKTADPLECQNLCFMGASVVSGYATGVIVHTGARTYLASLPPPSPDRAYLQASTRASTASPG